MAAIAGLFARLSIPYFLGGSFASSIQGEFRATNDLDFVCKFSPEALEKFLHEISPTFSVDEISARESWRSGRSFNIIHEETLLKVDIFPKMDDYREEQLRRAISVVIPGSTEKVRVASAEDIILAKLAWYRLGNESSERQWRDIAGVIKMQGSALDKVYIQSWSERLKVADLWRRAESEAGVG